jgi:O-antigen biosynthesis protein WbqP
MKTFKKISKNIFNLEHQRVKRTFDFSACFVLIILFLIPCVIISIAIKITSHGPILYWSERVGKKNCIFRMPKFRTMHISTPQIPTHLLENPSAHLTSIGSFLRKTSLDELPQLWCILNGDMSFVGPRPALFNQGNLIKLRSLKRVDQLTPGLTGWAQVNGRDSLSIQTKVQFDCEYLQKKSFFFDLKILCLTLVKVLSSKNISH